MPIQTSLSAVEGGTVIVDNPTDITTSVQTVRWYFQTLDFSADCIEITGISRLGLGGGSGSDPYNLLSFSPDDLILTILNARLPIGGLFYRVTTNGDRVFVDETYVRTQSKSVLHTCSPVC